MLVNVGIVHADIKPENILLKHRVRPLSLCRCAFAISVTLLHIAHLHYAKTGQSGSTSIRGVKLIDLGSSYEFLSPTRAAVWPVLGLVACTTVHSLPPRCRFRRQLPRSTCRPNLWR